MNDYEKYQESIGQPLSEKTATGAYRHQSDYNRLTGFNMARSLVRHQRMIFNPYTGKPRTAQEISEDPYGERLEATTAAPESPPAWRSVATIPTTGDMVKLLVKFSENPINEGDDDEPAVTIGAVAAISGAAVEVTIAGWDWSHDCFTNGKGEILGWLPLTP